MSGGPLKSARPRSSLTLALLSGLLFVQMARADGLTGVWATDASNCDKIFSKTANGVSFAKESDIYGSGFIVDGRKVTTPMARCDIKTSKQDGAVTHLILACASDVMLSSVQASFKMVNNDRVVRIFSGFSDMEIPYDRCVFK
jgi:hypothetical protein